MTITTDYCGKLLLLKLSLKSILNEIDQCPLLSTCVINTITKMHYE